MVLSMLTTIAVPVAAEGGIPEGALHVAKFNEEGFVLGDDVVNFYVETAADLVTASVNKALLTAGDTLYIANDIDVSTYVSATEGNTFGDDFSGLTLNININGLGHTISNYADTLGLIQGTYKRGTIQNLNFKDARIDNTAGDGGPGYVLIQNCSSESADVLIDNVHFIDCEVTAKTYAGMLYAYNNTNKNATTFTISNVSVSGGFVKSSSTYGAGILIGRAKKSGTTIIKNCVLYDCVLDAPNAVNAGGLVVGDSEMKSTSIDQIVTMDNVGVFNCTQEASAGAASSILITLLANHNDKSTINATNIYAAGNVFSTDSTSTADDVAMNALVQSVSLNAVLNVSNYAVDAVNYATYAKAAEGDPVTTAATVTEGYDFVAGIQALNASTTYTDWVYDGEGNISLARDYTALPLASTVLADDTVTEYQINSVAELVAAASKWNQFKAGDTVYLTADLDISTYTGDFATDFIGFGTGHDAAKNFVADFDGLNHTIYNYADDEAFFGGIGADVKNLKFSNAVVNVTAGTNSGALLFGQNCIGYGKTEELVFSNIHVYDSKVNLLPSTGVICGAIMAAQQNNKAARNFTFENCSVVNCEVSTTYTSSYGTGIFTARMSDKTSTHNYKNCIVANSTVTVPNCGNDKAQGIGVFVGEINARASMETNVTNCAMINNRVVIGSTGESVCVVAPVTNNAATTLNITNVYATGNTVCAGGSTTPVAIDNLTAYSGTTQTHTISVTDCKTDAGVAYGYKCATDSLSIANANAIADYNLANVLADLNANTAVYDWVLNSNGAPVIREGGELAPYTVTFVNVGTYFTDKTGKLILDDDTKATLASTAWKNAETDAIVAENADWSAMIMTGNASYRKAKVIDPHYLNLPLASTALADDTVTEYQINSVEELIAASNNWAAFKAGDTVYLTTHLDISTYTGDFATDFTNFHAKTSSHVYMNFNGLGHTISNYTESYPFFAGTYNATVSNLTFDNAVVNKAAVVSGASSAAVLMRTTEKGAVIDNVHLMNSSVTSVDENYTGGFVALVSNGGGAKNLTIKNSSISNTSVMASVENAGRVGLFVGTYAGRHSAEFVMENCVAVNSTVGGPSASSNGGGLLVGLTHNGQANAMKKVVFENIGVFGCTLQYGNADGNYSIVTAMNNGGPDFTYSNIHAAGNVLSTDATKTDDDVAINCLFKNLSTGFVINHGAVATDPAVEYAVYTTVEGATSTANEGKTTNYSLAVGLRSLNWGLDDNGNAVPMEAGDKAPIAVLFSTPNGLIDLGTSVNGKLAVNEETLAALKAEEWTLSTAPETVIPKDTAWEDGSYTADVIYNMVEHILSYVVNGDGTHTVSCSACDKEEHNGVKSCEEFSERYEAIDVAETYYALAKEGYLCACGREWQKEIPNEAPASPIEVVYGKDIYYTPDNELAVTVKVNENTNAGAFKVTVNYDPTYLTYKDAADLAASTVVVDNGNGVLTLGYANASGDYLTAAMDLATLNFTIQKELINAENNPELVVTATISEMVVQQADGSAGENIVPLTATVSDKVTVYFMSETFVAGDIDSDGVVDLLDVVLLIQKLNGKIAESQDFPAFHLMAADVNADGVLNTVDAVLMLKFVSGETVEGAPVVLASATAVPTWEVVTTVA